MPDGKTRCGWANTRSERYIRYHDEEWGVPVHDDEKLFELLLLEYFQAGLSWECVLNKRNAFRTAFDGFDYEKISNYDEDKLSELRNNPEIIRNRLKIRAAVTNARVFCEIRHEFGSFSAYLWGRTNGKVIFEQGKTSSALSDALSKDLKKRGMKFVGTLWGRTNGKVIFEQGKTSSALSDALSKDLKKRGMKFVGTTIVYSYLQAVGVIYSHEHDCFLERKE